MELEALFRLMAKHGASDLHLKPEQVPAMRVRGQLGRVADMAPVGAAALQALLHESLDERQREQLPGLDSFDQAVELEGLGYLRCHWFRQTGSWALAARLVSMQVPSLQELRLPKRIQPVLALQQGLVLITGGTNAGKSTTLAAILNHYNQQRACHIITLEDPIEYLFTPAKALISQRELGIDFSNLAMAVRDALHQDPDIVMIAELRDAETVEAALRAAETGHLVFATVHAATCAAVLPRILDLFPTEAHTGLRNRFGLHLRMLINQKLLPDASDDSRRVPVVESCVITPAARRLLVEGRERQLHDAMQQDRARGSCPYNQALMELLQAGLISKPAATVASPQAEELESLLSGISVEGGRILE